MSRPWCEKHNCAMLETEDDYECEQCSEEDSEQLERLENAIKNAEVVKVTMSRATKMADYDHLIPVENYGFGVPVLQGEIGFYKGKRYVVVE